MDQNDDLTFSLFRERNMARRKTSKYPDKEWGHCMWMMALVGEVGELANLLKKVERGDFVLEEVIQEVSHEIGDIQAYLDILAESLGVSLGDATVDKFNIVSKRIGSDITI